MSDYQSFKLLLLDFLPLSKDAVHVYIGLTVLLVWVAGLRRPLEWTSLVPVFAVALLMETVDLMDDLRWLGHPRWSASLHDLVNTTFWPVVLVFAARLGWLQSKRGR